jgi:hypothetical protein
VAKTEQQLTAMVTHQRITAIGADSIDSLEKLL